MKNNDCEQVLCKQVLASTAMVGWQLRQLDCLCCRNSCKLPLPAFMLNTGSTPIILCNDKVVRRIGRDQHKDSSNRTEFRLLDCKYPGLCNTCDCSGTTLCTRLSYGGTSSCETQAGVYPAKPRVQLLLMLGAWGQHAGVSLQKQELRLDPERSVRMFDLATIGNATMACTRVERSKLAGDSVVLTKSNEKYWAGQMGIFLSHAPHDLEDCHPSEEANIAEVDWYADAVPVAGISNGLSVCLGCPVFKRHF